MNISNLIDIITKKLRIYESINIRLVLFQKLNTDYTIINLLSFSAINMSNLWTPWILQVHLCYIFKIFWVVTFEHLKWNKPGPWLKWSAHLCNTIHQLCRKSHISAVNNISILVPWTFQKIFLNYFNLG